MTFETREQLMRDFDAREERLDAIRASAVCCEQCGKAVYTSKGYRQIERNRGRENWMNLCWDCIDEIVREAYQ